MPDSNSEEAWEGALNDIINTTANAILKYRPECGDLLDVGAGFGGFLARAAQDGWKLHGIEPNDSAIAVARDRLGNAANLQQAIFETANLQPKSYDCIVMMNVIEHVREPLEIARRAMELLRPGGCLALRWPQMVFMNRWRNRLRLKRQVNRIVVGAPLHLHDYTRNSMETLYRRGGFVDVCHSWAGTREVRSARLPFRLGAQLLKTAVRSVHTTTGGRCIFPFFARLTLGRKPVENTAGILKK